MSTAPYWLVLTANVADPEVIGPFASAFELAERLKSCIGTRCWAFVFRGERIHISTGPLRYLLHKPSDGIPLFDPTPNEPELSGSLFDGLSDPSPESGEGPGYN